MADIGHFEKQEHRLSDGSTNVVPVYVGEGGRPLPESAVLLKAAEVVISTIARDGSLTVEELADSVGRLLVNPDQKRGIIIEDEDSVSSVKITPRETVVSAKGIGHRMIPTGLIFDMLFIWSAPGDTPK